MPVITKEITIDVCRSNTLGEFDGIQAKQGDIGSRFLTVQLTNEGEPVPVEASSVVTLNALKPDGTRTCTAGTVNEDGTITVELSGQTLTVKGAVDCDISVLGTDGSKLTSATFLVNVLEASVTDGDIESADDYGVLHQLILQVETFTAAEAVRQKNETARQAAEQERIQTNHAVKELVDSFVGGLPIANTTTPGCVKSGGGITVAADGTVALNESVIKGLIQAAQQQMYPIGKIEVTCTNINPATYLGFGTWVQFGQGRTLFGVDPSDSDFNAPGKTGGNKTHKLVAAEIPSNEWKQAERVAAYGDSVGNIGHTGEASQAFSLLPPYVTVYFWRRTA